MNEGDKITYFAETDFRNKKTKFGIKAIDRTRHVYTIGKTGMGKSTMLETMAIQDIQDGNGVAFIDPHGGTAEKLLDYIPENRIDDVIYFAPFDMEHPISFNVMEDVGYDKRHLVVSGLMSAFEKIWADMWSARMAYFLSNTLFALLEYPGSTLLDINKVLINKAYRKKVVDNVSDPAVKAFWTDEFAKLSDKFATEATAAIQNKIGQFTSNPLIRNIVGQPKSTFDIREIMDSKKILIMNLSKGRIGEGNTNLLGSMLITKIYLAAMSRADLSPSEIAKEPNFYFFVDEFQSFANKSFADILSEARKYKLNLTIAHQYIEQMEEEVRSAVFGNVGTMIVFRVGSFDAEIFEKEFAPQFTAEDIVNLGFAQIYLRLMVDGIGSKPFSATTILPQTQPKISYKERIIKSSQEAFGKPRAEVERVIEERLGTLNKEETKDSENKKPQVKKLTYNEMADKRQREEKEKQTEMERKKGRVSGKGKEEEKTKHSITPSFDRHSASVTKTKEGQSSKIPQIPQTSQAPQIHQNSKNQQHHQYQQHQKPISLDTLKNKKPTRMPINSEKSTQNKSALKSALADLIKENEVENKQEEKSDVQKSNLPSLTKIKEGNDNHNDTQHTEIQNTKKTNEVPEDVLKKILE